MVRAKREEAIERTQQRTEELLKQKDETKRSNEKYAIQEMMKVHTYCVWFSPSLHCAPSESMAWGMVTFGVCLGIEWTWYF